MDIYPVPERVSAGSPSPIPDMNRYREVYANAKNDPEGFWLRIANERIAWQQAPTMGLTGDYHTIDEGPLSWFADGTLNATVSCLDRHLATRGDKVAILWEGDEPGDNRRITYRELHAEVCRLANGMTAMGVQKGDRVIIYMGMVPEAAMAMLACARLGAIHSVVFGGFSAESVRDRVRDSQAEWVITQDEGLRGGRKIPLKAVVDQALEGEQGVKRVIVYQRTDGARSAAEGDGAPMGGVGHSPTPTGIAMHAGRDVFWNDVTTSQPPTHAPVIVPAEHPLYILYTSGSTGKPKGVVHTTGGYLTYVSPTRTRSCSTCARTTSTRASPTSAGSRATATSCTGRSRTAARR